MPFSYCTAAIAMRARQEKRPSVATPQVTLVTAFSDNPTTAIVGPPNEATFTAAGDYTGQVIWRRSY
jgi:hypothetical protein